MFNLYRVYSVYSKACQVQYMLWNTAWASVGPKKFQEWYDPAEDQPGTEPNHEDQLQPQLQVDQHSIINKFTFRMDDSSFSTLEQFCRRFVNSASFTAQTSSTFRLLKNHVAHNQLHCEC